MIKVNLLPGKKKVKMPEIPIGTILGILIILGVSYYLFYIVEEENQKKLETLNQDIQKLKVRKKALLGEKQEKIAQIRQQINETENQIELIKRLVGAEMVPWSSVFEDLSGIVPKKTVWLKSYFSEGTDKVSIAGMATTDHTASGKLDKKKIYSHVSEFMNKLEQFEGSYYSQVILNNAQRTKVHGQDAITFTINTRMDRVRTSGGGAVTDGGDEEFGDDMYEY
jgi:Tfp pilus assembly protein PilN